MSSIYRVIKLECNIENNGLEFNLIGIKDSVRLLGFTFIPILNEVPKNYSDLHDLIIQAGKYGSPVSVSEIKTQIERKLNKDKSNTYLFYWNQELGFLSEAERFKAFEGWEWATELTDWSIFDRMHQALMLYDAIVELDYSDLNPLKERTIWSRGKICYDLFLERGGDYQKGISERDLNELEEEKHRDPIEKLKKYILENKIAEQNEIDALYEDVVKEIDIAADWALTRADPTADTSTRYNYSEFRLPDSDFEKTIPNGEKIVMVDAINHAMHEEMKFNDKLLIFGEDVADKKGGVFTATKGLSNEFSEDRVFNSPLAEASIIGVALGLATRGYKPCVEIQFGDYIWPAFMQLKNEVATLRYRSNNGFKCPMVVRVAVGGYINGGLYHSQNIEAFFAHIPGLIVVYPSNAADAKGLLKTACRIDDPVIFCEHKDLYRSSYAASPEPDENYLLDFGKGKIVQEGSDITIVTSVSYTHLTLPTSDLV